MKIGINLLPLRPGKIGGMEIYVRNLLAKLSTIDRDNEYYLITTSYNDASVPVPCVNFKKIVFSDEQTVPQKIKNCVCTLSGKSSGPDSTPPKNYRPLSLGYLVLPFFKSGTKTRKNSEPGYHTGYSTRILSRELFGRRTRIETRVYEIIR